MSSLPVPMMLPTWKSDRPMKALRKLFRWLVRSILLIAGAVAAGLVGLYIYMSSGRYVTTENAYVKAELITITSEVSGRVTEVLVGDNQVVEKGDVLFRIDPKRFEVERDRRSAELAVARQQVETLRARYRTKLAELAAAESDLSFLKDELERSERLRASGTISQFRLLEVRREAAKAETSIQVIREEISEALVALAGDPKMNADDHPDVVRAKAALDEAEIELAATVVRAPARAVTANLRLQAGEYVAEETPILSLVSRDGYWVEANLKETDLTHLVVGQDAILTVDAYPDVEWRATVASLSPATGAEYALLPPQNASGNWVKVVQRVPVRLAIELPDGAPPLRAGMSVAVSIDTEHERPLPEVLSKARAWIMPAEAK